MAPPGLRGAITGVAADGKSRQSRFSGATPHEEDHRTGAERDRDRILYSWQWRRLARLNDIRLDLDEGRGTVNGFPEQLNHAIGLTLPGLTQETTA